MIVAISINAQSLQFTLSVKNNWNKAKTDEPVVIKLSDVKGLSFDVASADIRLEQTKLPYQLDDLNGDGKADELVFLADIDKQTQQDYHVILKVDTSEEDFTPRVYAELQLDDKKGKHPFITSIEAPGQSYLYNDLYHHGVAFESEQTAYRVYFDQRQNIDIYGKKLNRLELAETHFYSTANQMQQDYGNDVLWAGNSIGCGSFKGWNGTAPTNIEPVKIRGQRLIANGPLRTISEVKAIGWNGLNMRQYYIIYAGHRECEVHVTFDKPLQNETFTTGVQKIGPSPVGFVHNNGIAASWGKDYPEMGNKELYPQEAVGLAVYVPVKYIKGIKESDLNYLFILNAETHTSINYYVSFCADKEKDGFHNANDWFDSLKQWKDMLDHPSEVTTKYR